MILKLESANKALLTLVNPFVSFREMFREMELEFVSFCICDILLRNDEITANFVMIS